MVREGRRSEGRAVGEGGERRGGGRKGGKAVTGTENCEETEGSRCGIGGGGGGGGREGGKERGHLDRNVLGHGT